MNKEELKQILGTSIRSRTLLAMPSIGAVKVGEDYIILKKRPAYQFDEEKAIYYQEEQDMMYPYKELTGEIVVYGHNLFNRRGQEAIREYEKTNR